MRLFILFLAIIFSSNLLANQVGPSIKLAPVEVKEFYKSRDNKTVWTNGKNITEIGAYAESALINADEEGLNPADYHDGVQALRDLRKGRILPDTAEVIFAKSFFKYVNDVYNGRFDPNITTMEIWIKQPSVKPGHLIKAGIMEGGTAWIDRLPPNHPQYAKLKKSLINYPQNDDMRAKIITSMESWRWMPRFPGTRYLLVNIPFYELLGYENRNEVMQSFIIVGNSENKTPVFSADIFEIIFNPEWHVPENIAKKELLPEGRAYLESEGFRKTKYGLVQKSGPDNALGRLRFSMHEKGKTCNKYQVYIHDTNDKELFYDEALHIGHGCIRVQKIVTLAKFVFNESSKWSKEQVKKIMEDGTTQSVKLKDKIPVYMVYFTAWANDDGTADFAEDIYGHHKSIKNILRIRSE